MLSVFIWGEWLGLMWWHCHTCDAICATSPGPLYPWCHLALQCQWNSTDEHISLTCPLHKGGSEEQRIQGERKLEGLKSNKGPQNFKDCTLFCLIWVAIFKVNNKGTQYGEMSVLAIFIYDNNEHRFHKLPMLQCFVLVFFTKGTNNCSDKWMLMYFSMHLSNYVIMHVDVRTKLQSYKS